MVYRIKVLALTQATAADQKAACEWCKVGAVGCHKDQVGVVVTNAPDGDTDIRLNQEGWQYHGSGCWVRAREAT